MGTAAVEQTEMLNVWRAGVIISNYVGNSLWKPKYEGMNHVWRQ